MLDRGYRLECGWVDPTIVHKDGGFPMTKVAWVNEYGTPGTGVRGSNTDGFIPPRPFMRPAIDKNIKKWKDLLKTDIKKQIKNGGSIASSFNKLGKIVVGDIQEEITNVWKPELAGYTIKKRAERRGIPASKLNDIGKKPLEDTGLMLQTCEYVVTVKQ